MTSAKGSRACVVLLRLLALGAALSATIVMASSHETTTFFNITLEAKFQYTPSFTFFLIANAIGAAYSLLVLFVPPTGYLSRLVVVLDVVVAMLLTAAVAAAGAISEVGKKGNQHAGWLPICDQIHKFCDQVMISLICGFIGLVVYFVIVLRNLHGVVDHLLP